MYDESQDHLALDKKFGRPWATEMVVIPKALALDLIHSLCGVGCIIHEIGPEACDAGEHERFAEKHATRMDALETLACDRINDQDQANTAENMLRALAMIYEGAALTKAS